MKPHAFGISICLLLIFTLPLTAKVTVTEDYNDEPGRTLVRMTVMPAAEPVPALKYRFVVPMHERKPGNAATQYLRAYADDLLRTWRHWRKEYGEPIDDWCGTKVPVEDLPLEDVKKVAGSFSTTFESYIGPATHCRRCDWGLEEMDLRGMETIQYMLPDTQNSREICRALALTTRLAIAEQRYEDAIEFIRMNYQLGQDIGKQRFLVSNLVGIAEVGVANKTVIDLIGAPNSPNLYWALSQLPRPIIPMHESMNLEMSLGLRMFPELLDAESVEHTAEEWTAIVKAMINNLVTFEQELGGFRLPDDELLAHLSVAGVSLIAYPAAKKRLIESGKEAKEVERMSVAQVLIIDATREYQRLADEHEKWSYVPYIQAKNRMRRAEREIAGKFPQAGFGNLLASFLLPAVNAARNALERTEWEMAALRTIEAIRMHAAETGELPTSLDDIRVVPVPLNPVTGNSFIYQRMGNFDGNKIGVLELPFSDGLPDRAWRFEIELTE